ncbi:MAG: adenylate kinase [Nocardioidaceae bacterium]
MATGELRRDTRRILVYGVTGSGKTTLAERLSDITGIEWHSVDELTWEPGWVPVPVEEQRRRIKAICARPEWILDTAYGDWLDIPLPRAEVIVALDYPRWFSLQRLLRRTIVRWADQRTICNGNRETLRVILARDSIIVWHFTSFRRKRDRIRRWCDDPSGPRVVRLTSARRTDAWLAEIPQLAND